MRVGSVHQKRVIHVDAARLTPARTWQMTAKGACRITLIMQHAVEYHPRDITAEMCPSGDSRAPSWAGQRANGCRHLSRGSVTPGEWHTSFRQSNEASALGALQMSFRPT